MRRRPISTGRLTVLVGIIAFSLLLVDERAGGRRFLDDVASSSDVVSPRDDEPQNIEERDLGRTYGSRLDDRRPIANARRVFCSSCVQKCGRKSCDDRTMMAGFARGVAEEWYFRLASVPGGREGRRVNAVSCYRG